MVDAGECQFICAEQIKIASEYVKLEGEKSCDCLAKVEELQEQLDESKKTIDTLTVQA